MTKKFLVAGTEAASCVHLKMCPPYCLDEYLIHQPRIFIANTKTPASKEAVSRQQAIQYHQQRYRNQANPLFV